MTCTTKRRRKKPGTTFIVAAVCFLWAIAAGSAQAGEVKVSNVVAQTMEDSVNGRRIEVYMTIENTGAARDRLYAVRSKLSHKSTIAVVEHRGHDHGGADHAGAEHHDGGDHGGTGHHDGADHAGTEHHDGADHGAAGHHDGADHGAADHSRAGIHMQATVLDIQAGATAVLHYGGSHIMLMNPTENPAVGSRFPVTLFFERAGRINVEATVEPTAAGH
jgi:copper(I)-binding protein